MLSQKMLLIKSNKMQLVSGFVCWEKFVLDLAAGEEGKRQNSLGVAQTLFHPGDFQGYHCSDPFDGPVSSFLRFCFFFSSHRINS